MLFFTTSNLKSAKTFKSRRVLLSRKTFFSGISKLILRFPYAFDLLCTILSIVNFHTVLPMFVFLFYWSHLKAGTVHLRDSSLFRKRSIMGQVNVQAATTENQEQYTLSNIIHTLFFEVFLDKQLFLKGR